MVVIEADKIFRAIRSNSASRLQTEAVHLLVPKSSFKLLGSSEAMIDRL